jgi:hypothetical protein
MGFPFLLECDENPDHTKTTIEPPTASPVTAMPVATMPMVATPTPVPPVPVPVPVAVAVAPPHFLRLEAIDVFLRGNGRLGAFARGHQGFFC